MISLSGTNTEPNDTTWTLRDWYNILIAYDEGEEEEILALQNMNTRDTKNVGNL